MPVCTHQHTLNVALGEVLGQLRRSWQTRTEQTGQVLAEGGRPDILIEGASGWPVNPEQAFFIGAAVAFGLVSIVAMVQRWYGPVAMGLAVSVVLLAAGYAYHGKSNVSHGQVWKYGA